MTQGFLEEISFRGVMLNGFLAGLGRWRWGVFASVFISCVFFGQTHIVVGDITDAASLAQVVLKLLQADMFDVVM